MDAVFIIAGVSAAALLFMLAFLIAIARELRQDRVRRNRESRENSLTLVMFDRYRRKNRAA